MMVQLIDDPRSGERIGRKARARMAAHYHFLPRGLAYARRLNEIWSAASAAQAAGRGEDKSLSRLSARTDA